MTPHEDLLP